MAPESFRGGCSFGGEPYFILGPLSPAQLVESAAKPDEQGQPWRCPILKSIGQGGDLDTIVDEMPRPTCRC